MKLSIMWGWLGSFRQSLNTQLWPIPTLGVVLALGLGVGLPRMDAAIDQDLSPTVTAFLFGGGPGAARTVLQAIAGSLVTVTSLTFSLTVVTLQLASSQFSPRLLRTFTSDRFVHVTLALFLSTFTYSLTVLRTVRTVDESQDAFVPQVSVTAAYLLGLASVVGLVLFLAHLVTQIRVETMLRNVHRDATQTARRLTTEHGSPHGSETADLLTPPAGAWPVLARTSGFLLRVDEDALLAAAVDLDVDVLIDREPGSSLVAGTPVGAVWSRSACKLDQSARDDVLKRIASTIVSGFEPTSFQDIGFGLRQLTDVATKALSPGVNDPTTAVHALGHSAALLCELACRDLGPRLLRDDHHRVRVVLRRPTLADLLETAVTQPRRYGASDPVVLQRLAALLREVAWCTTEPDHRLAIELQLDRLRATIAGADFDSVELERLAAHTGRVDDAFAGRWFGSP